jgi:superfamily II DNA or RNA helicase
MLTREGYQLHTEDPRVKKAKKELLVAPIDRSGIQKYPRYFPVWWTSGDTLVAPRFWAQEAFGLPPRPNFGPVTPIDVDFCGSLRADLDQLKATDAVMTKLRDVGGALLCLGTGQGKTTCACWVIAQLRVKTVVLVHKDVLRSQWAERIAQFLPNATISYVQGTTCDLSGDVVIAMLQTLTSPGRTFAWPGVGLVVCDEAHHISAETFSTAMRGLCCPYSLGLSATPERKDGLTKIMHWFLGPSAYTAQRREMRHVIVDFLRYTSPRYKLPPPTTRFGTINHAAVLSDMADDGDRTAMIVQAVTTLRRDDPERIVLILSHRREHCLDMARAIPGAVAFLGGPKKKAEKNNTDHTTAPVVCATYALASEGYDDARLNTLVLATPCSDVTQAAGRILRGASAKDPLILDVQDDFSVAYAQSAKRKTYYRTAGFTYATQVQKEYPKCIIID